MAAIDPNTLQRQIRPILAALKTPVRRGVLDDTAAPSVPFITISREAGAGAKQIAQRLVQRLNEIDPAPVPWTSWDRELIEKVATDHNISHEVVESLMERDRSWLSDILSGLAVGSKSPSDETIFRNVSTTVRALARAGRVVIVGLGGVFITGDLAGGVHVRRVASADKRIDALARRRGIPRTQAETEMRRLERNRQAFFTSYWPQRSLSSDAFDLTLNVGRLTEAQMIECIVPLIRQPTRKTV
ncbi:MAG: cytidylate kinase-like family protein [Phycisphaerales bacterium]|nr:cytidylate kinase-like family protein [Phycisphaerales bacterium]